MSIRSIISSTNPFRLTPTRSIGYLHKGTRVRGLTRDPIEYLKNPKGIAYELNESNLKSLKEFLGDEYKLPNELSLQILTHKSFAHGSKPFNEKLAVYGSHFLKYKTSLYSIQSNSNLNIDNLGSLQSKNLNSQIALSEFLRQNRKELIDSIFWKKRDPLITDPNLSGENSVISTTLKALIGGILLHYGKDKAETFVEKFLLNESNENSLVSIAKRV